MVHLCWGKRLFVYDQYNQNVGINTPLDFLYNEKTHKSRNPMDSNWGGKEYTKKALKDGDYKGREIYRYTDVA